MNEYELPTNIKQMGNIGSGIRIYVEDYVCSFLQQYAESGGYEEKLALLIGRYMIIDNQEYLFISGAVAGKYCEQSKGIYVFTEKSKGYTEEMINRYFKGLDIVGWMQSQPSYGVFLNPSYANYHMQNFTKIYHTMFVCDPIEKTNAFYTYDKKTDDLKDIGGYFIYYEKNRGMNEYMMDNKGIELKLMPQTDDDGYSAEELLLRKDTTPDVMITKRQIERNVKRATAEQKRVVNLLVSLSAVLFIICFIMGAGLIQNEDRITNLEYEISQIGSAYKALTSQLRMDNSTSVFASQPDSVQTQGNTAQNDAINNNSGNQIVFTPTEKPAPTPMPATAVPTPVQTTTPTPTPSTAASAVETASFTASNIPDTYTVERGDNLNYISIKFYGDTNMVDKIMELNSLDNPDKIYFGKVLKLPK